MVTGLWLADDDNQIYVVSLYTHSEEKDPDFIVSPLLKKLVKQANQEDRQVLILGDLNAWSRLWGETRPTNIRGNYWEEFISDESLLVHNKGKKSTYVRYNAQ